MPHQQAMTKVPYEHAELDATLEDTSAYGVRSATSAVESTCHIGMPCQRTRQQRVVNRATVAD
jgi:hypothetical protein